MSLNRYAFVLALLPFGAMAQTNDFCQDVIPVPLALGSTIQFTGDNTGATIQGDFVPGSTLGNLNIPSTWHAFTVTSCANITINYCGTSPAFVEFWNVLATTCPANNVYQFTPQYNYTTCGDGNPTLYFQNVPAATYYYPVWFEDPGGIGPYEINVSATACGGSGAPNDQCGSVTPEPLAPGGSLTFTGDNSLATSGSDWVSGSPFAGAPVVWHAFTLNECTSVSLAYCGQDPVWGNTLGVLARACPGGDLVYFTTFDNTACSDGNRTYYFNSLAVGTYYVPVLLHPSSGSTGPYSITLNGTACPPPPTYYDLCSQIQFQPLAVGASITFAGDNTSATTGGDWPVGSPFAAAPVVWHGFTTTSCARVSIAYCGQTPAWGNTLGFLARDCPASDLQYFTLFNDTDCGDGNRTYTYSNLPAGSYRIPVLRDPANGAIGAYTIQVSATSCPAVPPANDNCASITAVNLPIGSTITVTGDNTNATSTGDFVSGSPFVAAPVTWHAFELEDCTDLVVAYCAQSPSWSNTLGVLATACPGDGLVYFHTGSSNCGNGNATYIFNDLTPGVYYLPVLRDAPNNSFGSYSIDVSAEDCLFLGNAEALTTTVLSAWPNPSRDAISITGLAGNERELRLLDALGRTMFTVRLSGQRTVTLPLRGIVAGTYFLVAQSRTSLTTIRVVVE
ncbi:MAG: T9SS type A sorting domain-containing protein [Flavobacteriales bacterium]|nr:T9SS type A sorting domain-containing protein [Flavobacteriales bacterium]